MRKSLILGLGLIGMSVLILKAGAQPDLTAEQSPLDATVQGYFDQAASAALLIRQTQRLQAAFDNAQTVTASFDATVQATFNTAATATQFAVATPIPLSAPNRVISTQQLDLVAGLGDQRAFLAPSGEHFAYVNRDEVCVYIITGSLAQCISLTGKMRSVDIEHIRWSSDSRYIILGEDFRSNLYEPDVWVIDTETGDLNNLTDDGMCCGAIRSAESTPADIDFPLLGLGDGRIAFLRYHWTRESSIAALYAIQPDGSDLEQLMILPVEESFPVDSIAVSHDGRYLAYNWNSDGKDVTRDGLWIVDLQTEERRHLFQAPNRIEIPQVFTFSADGQYLLWKDRRNELAREDATPPDESSVRAISVDGGEPILISEDHTVYLAWWSPHDSALAYLVHDRGNPAVSGLYVTSAPGEAGELILNGFFLPPHGRISVPMMWATNNTIILSNAPDQGIMVVELGN